MTTEPRSDLLCIEGIARALRVFLQLETCPQVKTVLPLGGEKDLITCHIAPEVCFAQQRRTGANSLSKVAQVRAYTAAAILRGVTFTPSNYASFIDLQDKLHHNICRKRQLVSIGTHDLDTIKPPFRYEARAPTDIKFTPLNKTQDYNAKELMTVYEVGHTVYTAHLTKYNPSRKSILLDTCTSSKIPLYTRSGTIKMIRCSRYLQSSTRNTRKSPSIHKMCSSR